MEVLERGGSHGRIEVGEVEHEARCRVLDQRFNHRGRESGQERVAVVKAGDDQSLDQELSEEGPDPADVGL